MWLFSSNSKNMYITISCISVQAGLAERDITTPTSVVDQIAKPLKLTH